VPPIAAAVAITVAVPAFAAVSVAAVLAMALGRLASGFCCGLGGFRRRSCAGQPIDQLPEQASAFLGTARRRCRSRHRSRLRWRDAFYQGFRTRLGFLRLVGRPGYRRFGLGNQFETGLDFFQAWIVVTQALDMMM